MNPAAIETSERAVLTVVFVFDTIGGMEQCYMSDYDQKEKQDNQPSKRPSGGAPNPVPPSRTIGTWFVLLFVVGLGAMLWQNGSEKKTPEISFTEALAKIENNQVAKVEIVHDAGMNFAVGENAIGEKWRANIGEKNDSFEKLLIDGGINVEHKRQNRQFEAIMYSIGPTLLLIGVLVFIFMRQMKAIGGNGMTFGKSRAKRLESDTKKVTFADVAGIEEAKEEVVEIIDYLKDPVKFKKLGGKMPKGVLMCGSPGTGKTLLAKAIAGEANVPFFSISGSDFVEMFVGVGASRVRDMFEQAHKNSPCLLFIDEIDAVGRSRFTGIGGGHDEREQTLNALLVEMDGFEANDGVIVIAATNRPDVLDPALLRPGRFDRQVVIDLPSLEGRIEILKVHAAKIKLAAGIDFALIARGTPGFSGADLANLINEAALIATRQNKEAVDIDDLEDARDKVMFGKERRSRKIDDDDKKITSFHEAGHAICTVLLPDAEPLHKITIIPRGMSLGSTMFLPKKDRTHITKSKLIAQLTVAMGGRAAEEVFLPDICTGASQDLSHATQIAHSMVCAWGMSEKLGPRTFGHNEELIFLGKEVNRTQDYSEKAAQEIDAEVSRLLNAAHDQAVSLLTAHRDATEKLVAELLEKETVSGYVAEELVKYGRVRDPEERGDSPPPVPPPMPNETANVYA